MSEKKHSVDQSVGQSVCVEVPLNDGTHSFHLGRIVQVTPTEICIDSVSWVKHTGRYSLFFTGDPDENAQIETLPPGLVRRLPRWGSVVTDYPKLPTKSK